MNIDLIKKKKTYYETELYQSVRKEQGIDQTYRDDTFLVPEVSGIEHVYHLGTGARMVDAPAEQIVTSNPQFFIEMLSKSEKSDEVSKRIAYMVNQKWIPIIKMMNPNPPKEYVKNCLARGESFYQLAHNELWVTGKKVKEGLPVFPLVPEPMIIFASPQEDEPGIPSEVFVIYERQLSDVILMYPKWSDPKGKKEKDEKRVSWWAYFNKDEVYAEADEEPVWGASGRPNIYKVVPFIRQYSGFGRRSPDGDLSKLIVGDLKNNRDLIRMECAAASDNASILHLFPFPSVDIISEGEEPSEFKYDMTPAGVNKFFNTPLGSIKIDKGLRQQPSPESIQHLQDISIRLAQRNPHIMAGFPASSGRERGMMHDTSMRRYETVVENTEKATALAIKKMLLICKNVPGLYPEELHKGDLDFEFECSVKLRAPDPAEEDRLATLGDRLWNMGQGSIDLKTNLVQYQGKTQDEADKIITNILVDRITIQNPEVAEVMGMVFAEESGMESFLRKAQERNAMMEGQKKGLQEIPKTTEQRIKGESRSGEVESNRGARTPPLDYRRGGM